MTQPAAARPDDLTPAVRLHEAALGKVLGYQLAQATIVTSGVFEAQVAARHQLRPVEYTVLALVRHNPGTTAAKLATALALTPPNMAALLDKLTRRGYVARQPHAQDRRALQLLATGEGEAAADAITEALCQAEAQAFDALSLAERLMLLELLHKAGACRHRA